MNTVLQVKNLSKFFGGVKANQDISIDVPEKKIIGLIGPNGSGKTTLFNSICGTYPIDSGSVNFNGKEISSLPIPEIAKLGLLRTFQQTHIYGKLNCVQNMLISAKPKRDSMFSVFDDIPLALTSEAEKLLEDGEGDGRWEVVHGPMIVEFDVQLPESLSNISRNLLNRSFSLFQGQ